MNDEHAVLALQRQLGNQAVVRLLRSDKGPTTLGDKPVSKDQLNWLTDASEWARLLREGGEEYLKLYAEIATLLQADKLADVKGTAVGDINGALHADYASLKPGLNWITKFDSRARTAYLYDGKWSPVLPSTLTGEEPKVAIVLSKGAFEPDNKAHTLAVLRHELEHGVHNRMAADWLMKWRGDEKAKAKRVPFPNWLRAQTINPVDRALVEERLSGAASRTESLANLEGFMAAFATEQPGLSLADNPAEEELRDVAQFWVDAESPAVQAEVIKRLQAYGGRLEADVRTRFLATLKKLRAENSAWKDLLDPVIASQARRPAHAH